MIGYALNPKSGQPLKYVPVYCFRADTRAAHTTPSTTTDTVGKYAFTDLDPTLPYIFEVRFGTTVLTQFRPIIPMARVYNDANISIPNTTTTALTFNSERYDTDTMHSTSANTSRMTVATKGTYRFSVNVTWAASAAGLREITLVHSSGTVIADNIQWPGAATAFGMDLAADWSMAVGEYVEAKVYQDSGGPLNVEVHSAYSPEFSAVMVSGG